MQAKINSSDKTIYEDSIKNTLYSVQLKPGKSFHVFAARWA